jgi:hypothetical protein
VKKRLLSLAAIASLIIPSAALAGQAPTASIPLGDQHVALLAQQLNDLESATNLFQRCINQDRPIVEALNASTVLADNFDRMCALLFQFYVWAKAETASGNLQFDFSPAGREQLRDLCIRTNTVFHKFEAAFTKLNDRITELSKLTGQR